VHDGLTVGLGLVVATVLLTMVVPRVLAHRVAKLGRNAAGVHEACRCFEALILFCAAVAALLWPLDAALRAAFAGCWRFSSFWPHAARLYAIFGVLCLLILLGVTSLIRADRAGYVVARRPR